MSTPRSPQHQPPGPALRTAPEAVLGAVQPAMGGPSRPTLRAKAVTAGRAKSLSLLHSLS